MKLIELEERKQIQMQIMDAVDEFCRKENIRYSLSCGTLLGAIRHGGYIPWDDDIDIYMPREDYNKFEEAFPEKYKGYINLASLKRRKDWVSPVSKVYDDRTILIEHIISNVPIGINIDIFPVDEIPDDETEWNAFNAERKRRIKFDRGSNRTISRKRPLWQNIAICILKLRYIGYNRRKYVKQLNSFIQKYNGKGQQRLFETSAGMRICKPFPKTLFNNLIEIPFEDKHYKGFQNYDEYLTDAYGDYMTPPPPEKRISYHTYDSYWK